MSKSMVILFMLVTSVSIPFGCGNNKNHNEQTKSAPAPVHEGMCDLKNLGEASSAVEKELPNNQYVELEGMSSPKTLVWQDTQTQQIYFATKILGAEGKLFFMDKLQTGQKPEIRSTFIGTLMLWKHLPKGLLVSMKAQFKEQWGVDVDENSTFILKANEKPEGCK